MARRYAVAGANAARHRRQHTEEGLPGEDTREEAQGRAAIATVKHIAWLTQAPHAYALHRHRRVVALNGCTESLHALDRAEAVGSHQKVGNAALPRASALNITARCEMDLSPGTAITPRRRRGADRVR